MASATPSDLLLQQHRIPVLPPSMFYIPNFISEDEEQRILEKVTNYSFNFRSYVCTYSII